MTNFYVMQASPNYSNTYGLAIGQKRYPQKCPECGRPLGDPLLPIKIIVQDRPIEADFVWSPPELLVTERVKYAFDSNQVKGIQYSEVIIQCENFDQALQSPLWHVLIHQGAHAAEKMHIVPRRECPVCGRVDYSTWDGGVVVEETTWDGADIFRLYEDVVGVIASEKVQHIATTSEFKGVRFVPAEEYKDPFSESRPRPKMGA